MAPYGGPSLIEIVKQLKKGKLPYAVGFGLPRAQFVRGGDGVLELRGLSGGEGFGVQPDLVNPFVDAGVLARGSWQEVVAWLCEHWDFGDAWGQTKERLHVRFSGDSRAIANALHRELQLGLAEAQTVAAQGITVVSLEKASAVCRAARTAGTQLDFDIVR